jgi:orotidine-5'-phosphate decarboxylase
MSRIEPKDRIILPLDVPSVQKGIELAELLSGHVGLFKIGLEFIWSAIADLLLFDEGRAIELLKQVRGLTRKIGAPSTFIDAKLDDIPNTVRGASIAISRLGVKMFNLHASAGRKAIVEAVANKGSSLVFGVTVLTSIDEEECVSVFGDKPGPKVLRFARMLYDEGADGIICSPQELVEISGASCFDGLLKATPGVRPEWAAVGDQKRVMTPAEAIRAGADLLVIGRPITKPPDSIGGPVNAAKLIAEEIASVSAV